MSLVDIQLIEGVFSPDEKADMIEKVTNAMVTIGGEPMRGLTWVRVHEVAEGAWGIGGKRLMASDLLSLTKGAAL
ncbi:MAG: 4-oxalocrotonate tautomerase [Boseongicola sp.]|nr:MAG: 4-oxalocrotonate tautomerase [Boseongicola sp.]